MDFLECQCCQHSILQKSKEFWASKYVRAVITKKASQYQFNNDLLQQLQKYNLLQGKVGGRKFVDRPRLHGYTFCWTRCFPFLHACQYTKMNNMRKQVEKGIEKWSHEGKGKHSHRRAKGFHVDQWIKSYQDVFGEYQPTDKKKIELPPDTKANLYISYLVEMEDKGYPKVSLHHFLKIWKEDFPNLILPKNCRLVCFFFVSHYPFFPFQVKCKICASCNDIIRNTNYTKERRKQERKTYEAHLIEVMKERLRWHYRRDDCLASEGECAAIYLDGMDQQKTDIPRLCTQDIREISKPMKVR